MRSDLAPASAWRSSFSVMGTVASLHVYDEADPARISAAARGVEAELRRLETMFSTFAAGSEISRIRQRRLDLLDSSPEVIDVLDACTWLEHASAGAFRARRPGTGELDPAGFVKGWAAERAANHLGAHGLRHWILTVGGDVLHGAPPPGGRTWRCAISDPRDPAATVALLEVPGGAVATSGTAARGRHLWDRDGVFDDSVVSVTVTGPSLTWADAFATTVWSLGPDGLAWLARFDGYQALTIDAAGTMRWTAGFPFHPLSRALLAA